MKARALLVLAIVFLVAVAGYGVASVRTAFHSIDSAGGELALYCEAETTDKQEVTVNVAWEWIKRNPHPGAADEIVILGPSEWYSMDEPGTKPPTTSGTKGQVQFGVLGEAADTVTSMVETGNVKAYAAVRPNEDGSATFHFRTSTVPVGFTIKGTVQYLMVERVPNPGRSTVQLSLAERLLKFLGVDRMQLFPIEKGMVLVPWIPDPPQSGSEYTPSLTVGDPAPDLNDVARELFTDYLEHYTSSEQPDGTRLEDYVITGIQVDEETTDRFWFLVDFSVKPVYLSQFWGAGNGEQKTDGWIEGKHLEMEVVREGNVFAMIGGGTGGR